MYFLFHFILLVISDAYITYWSYSVFLFEFLLVAKKGDIPSRRNANKRDMQEKNKLRVHLGSETTKIQKFLIE